MSKISAPPAVEHEDDRKARLDGEAYGKAHAAEFCKDNARSMQLLIETYADVDAAHLLDQLREMFWVQTWKPKETP